MTTKSEKTTGNVLLDHPGVSAAVFATVVLVAFLGALYNSATSGHHGSEGGGHKAAPAGEAHH